MKKSFFLSILLVTTPLFAAPDFSKLPVGPKLFTQLIWVKSSKVAASEASLWLKKNQHWTLIGESFLISVGKNGTAALGTKVEGDGKTPEGLFPLRKIFGRGKNTGFKLAFTSLTPKDKWVDDPSHPDYNKWVHGETKAKSFEELWRSDSLYDLFAVIGYNDQPVVAGKGSAIFMHTWSGPRQGTAGCVATDAKRLKKILLWLDSAQNPQIYIGEL